MLAVCTLLVIMLLRLKHESRRAALAAMIMSIMLLMCRVHVRHVDSRFGAFVRLCRSTPWSARAQNYISVCAIIRA